MGGGREGKNVQITASVFLSLIFFLAHVCPNVVWQSIEPCSIHEVSAAVSILLSVIRENAEKERLPRESQLCCLFSFSFSFPWKLWLIHSSHFSPAFHSPDSVTISHSTRRDFLCTCLCRLRYAGAPPLAPPLPSAGVRLGAEKKKNSTLLGLSVSQQTAGAGMVAS